MSYHSACVEQSLEPRIMTLIFRYALDTSLLDIEPAGKAHGLRVPAIANLECLAWHSSILLHKLAMLLDETV